MGKLILGHMTDRWMANWPAGGKSVHCYLAHCSEIQSRQLAVRLSPHRIMSWLKTRGFCFFDSPLSSSFLLSVSVANFPIVAALP